MEHEETITDNAKSALSQQNHSDPAVAALTRIAVALEKLIELAQNDSPGNPAETEAVAEPDPAPSYVPGKGAGVFVNSPLFVAH